MSFLSKLLPPNVEKMEMNKDIRGLVKATKTEKKGEAIQALTRIGEPAIDSIIQLVNDYKLNINETWHVLNRIASIANMKEKVYRRLIFDIENHPSFYVRRMAAFTLGNGSNLGSRESIVPLIKAMGDNDEGVRGFAVQALGVIDDPRTVEPLIQALEFKGDENKPMRINAISALGEKGDKRAIDPLINILIDDPGMRIHAHVGLNKLGLGADQIDKLVANGEKFTKGQLRGAPGSDPAGRHIASGKKLTDNRLQEALNLGQAGDYNTSLTLILQLLEDDPNNSEALNLAQTVLSIGDSNVAQSIRKDPLLDSVFAQCDKCDTSWVVDPTYKDAKRLVITNPAGGQCSRCGKVFCRNCAPSKDGGLICPNLQDENHKLDPVINPNGRTRRYVAPRSRSERIEHVVVFLYPPPPPRLAGYSQIVLESMCSEALIDDARISMQVLEEINTQTILVYLNLQGKANGWPDYLDQNKYEILHRDFDGPDGNKGVLVSVYRK